MFKQLSLVAIVGLCMASQILAAKLISWEEYKERFNKHYETPEEDAKRKEIFEQRQLNILAHNRLLSSPPTNEATPKFQRAINHLSDLTHEEYMQLNGFRYPSANYKVSSPEHEKFIAFLKSDRLVVPDSVDWSKHPNRVSSVKWQKGCGSCWAFATVGLLEGQEYRFTNASKVTEMSEQNLVDCDDLDAGCHGGTMPHAIQYVQSAGGLETEKDYPYKSGKTGRAYECAQNKSLFFETTRKIKGSQVLDEGDEELLKKTLAVYGPIAVAIDASDFDFGDYSSGIYYNADCRADKLNHAVLLVGYGTDSQGQDYWLIKNSWSEHWGVKGYGMMARNKNNNCGIAEMATLVLY